MDSFLQYVHYKLLLNWDLGPYDVIQVKNKAKKCYHLALKLFKNENLQK